MVPQIKDAAWLQWMDHLWGTDSPSSARFPSTGFYCLLDEQPDHLLPRSIFWDDEGSSAWRINPNCFFANDSQFPSELAEDVKTLQPFLSSKKTIWIQDPALYAWWPYGLGETLSSAIESSDETATNGLSREQQKILSCASLLLPATEKSWREKQWNAAIPQAQEYFAANEYVPIRGLIPSFLVAALRRYYRFHIRSGHLKLGDTQSSRRYIAHNEPVARYFHRQLTYAISAIAGKPLKPSYVYAGCYQEGADLKKHKDRAQCEYSFTFCLDYSPEPENETPWPIHLDTKNGTVTVFQSIGDALIYRGCQVPHYRHRLQKGHTSTSLFFHYVDEDFLGPLD
ncbi:MAG TPA: hypothetical protein VGF44_09700 [Terriglobales bacterium]